jgi:hypothetical protein
MAALLHQQIRNWVVTRRFELLSVVVGAAEIVGLRIRMEFFAR